jgi:hypothetical protein
VTDARVQAARGIGPSDGYEYSEANHWYVLRTRGYGKVRLSEYLDGVERVLDRLGRSGGDIR